MATATRIRVIKFNTRAIIKRTRKATKAAAIELGNEMTAALQKKLDKQGPPVSRPGQAPRKRTGNLQRRTVATHDAKTGFKIRVPQYGIWLEGGTSRMAARPFILPVIHDKKAKWSKRFNALIRKHMK